MTDDLQFLFSILHSPNDNVRRFQFCSQSKTERTSVGQQPLSRECLEWMAHLKSEILAQSKSLSFGLGSTSITSSSLKNSRKETRFVTIPEWFENHCEAARPDFGDSEVHVGDFAELHYDTTIKLD
jgi:hypothetical protein